MRALPWFKDAARRGQLGIVDCASCKERLDPGRRQALGCGYLPESDHASPWQPPSASASAKGVGYDGPTLAVCAGYTTSLPEIGEVLFYWRHWKSGNLAVALRDMSATDELLAAILMLDHEANALEAWRMTPSKDGGGGS